MKSFKKTLKVLVIVLGISLSLYGQTKKNDAADLIEYMKITNVQLIVRAIKDGKPLGGLKSSDFSLYENRRKVPITSFMEVRRKIGKNSENNVVPEVSSDKSKGKKKNRLFLFYYWVCEETINYQEALDYFFEKVFSKGDKVLLVVRDQYFNITNKSEFKRAKYWLSQNIKKWTKIYSNFKRRIMRDIEGRLEAYLKSMNRRSPDANTVGRYRKEFLQTLQFSWKEYLYKYLISNNNVLQQLADGFKKFREDKWGFVFFQEGTFPFVDYSIVNTIKRYMPSEADIIENALRKFRFQAKLPDQFFNRLNKVKQSFVDGDTTFHYLYMSPEKDNGKTGSLTGYTRFQMEKTYVGWQHALKGIAQVTGGEIMRAAEMKSSMEKTVEREDIYYRLTFSPQVLKKEKREIEILCSDKKVTVHHLEKININKRNMPADLRDIKLKRKIIKKYSSLDNVLKKAYLTDSIVNNNWKEYFKNPRILPYQDQSMVPEKFLSLVHLQGVNLSGRQIELVLLTRDVRNNKIEMKIIHKKAQDIEKINFTRNEKLDYYIVIIDLKNNDCFYNQFK